MSEIYDIKARYSVEGVTQSKAALDGMAGSATQAETNISSLGRVAEIAGGIIATKLLYNVRDLAAESIQMGAQFGTASAGFENLVENASDGVTTLESLREATRGMASDLDLMTAANEAVMLGLPVDQFNELYEVATKLGPVMGRDVTQAVNDLAMGIGRQSKMILDNLGIVVDLSEVYDDYAETLGKTSSELSEGERKQALFNAVMIEAKKVTGELEGTLDPTHESLMRWNASVDNAKTSLGVFLGTFVAGPLNTFADVLDHLSGRTDMFATKAEKAYEEVSDATGEMLRNARSDFDNMSRTFETNMNEILRNSERMNDIINNRVRRLKDRLDDLQDEINQTRKLAPKLEDLGSKIYDGGTRRNTTTTNSSNLDEAALHLASLFPAQHGFSGIVRRPTMFLAGEKGAEHVAVNPMSRGRGETRGRGDVNIILNLPNVHSVDDEANTRMMFDRVFRRAWREVGSER